MADQLNLTCQDAVNQSDLQDVKTTAQLTGMNQHGDRNKHKSDCLSAGQQKCGRRVVVGYEWKKNEMLKSKLT